MAGYRVIKPDLSNCVSNVLTDMPMKTSGPKTRILRAIKKMEMRNAHRIMIGQPEHTNGRYLREYLLTPWSRVLLEKLTGSAASQEIPRIFGTPRFITVLTSARHLSLS